MAAGDTPVILVVEDEALVRLAAADALRQEGFQVLEADCVAVAVEVFLNAPKVDLVFSDIRMPGAMDGLKFAEWLHERFARVPVILTSAYDKHGTAAQKFPFFQKPYELPAVVKGIREKLAR